MAAMTPLLKICCALGLAHHLTSRGGNRSKKARAAGQSSFAGTGKTRYGRRTGGIKRNGRRHGRR